MSDEPAKPVAPSEPLKLYLDQSVYGQMLDESPQDWKASRLGTAILKAQSERKIEVWASPTHVIETLQARDLERRQKLAMMILDLIEAKRMWWGSQFEAILQFIQMLEKLAPGSIQSREFFEFRCEVERRTWLGGLGLIASTGALSLDKVIQDLEKQKAVDQVLFARAAADPDNWLKQMLHVVDSLSTTDDPLGNLAHMSLEELRDERRSLEQSFKKPTKKTQDSLNKNRNKIAMAQGAFELSQILHGTFTLPYEMQLTFSGKGIVEGWPAIQAKMKCPSLPKEIQEASPGDLQAEPKLFFALLSRLIQAVARGWIFTTGLGFEVILREYQKKLTSKNLPTGGLTFDADHSASLVRFDVVLCLDSLLAESLKSLAEMVGKYSENHKPSVVRSVEELIALIQNR